MIAQLFETAGPAAAARHRLAICLHCGAGGRPCIHLAKAAGDPHVRCAHERRNASLTPALTLAVASCPENRW